MNEEQCGRWITKLINDDRLHEFYVSKQWRKLRKEVLDEQKSECQDCKKKGFYTKGNHVHHEQYVRNHPRLALSKTYTFKGEEKRNLVVLCHDCHEQRHGYRKHKIDEKPLTEERW